MGEPLYDGYVVINLYTVQFLAAFQRVIAGLNFYLYFCSEIIVF